MLTRAQTRTPRAVSERGSRAGLASDEGTRSQLPAALRARVSQHAAPIAARAPRAAAQLDARLPSRASPPCLRRASVSGGRARGHRRKSARTPITTAPPCSSGGLGTRAAPTRWPPTARGGVASHGHAAPSRYWSVFACAALPLGRWMNSFARPGCVTSTGGSATGCFGGFPTSRRAHADVCTSVKSEASRSS